MFGLMLEAAVRSLILAGAVWIALTALRVRHPLIRLTVWTGVLYAALAMPLLVLAGRALLPLLPDWFASSVQISMAIPAAVGMEISSEPVTSTFDIWQLGEVLYAAVAVLLFARLIVGLARGIALRARATAAEPRQAGGAIYISPEVTAPMVFGAAILLPADSTAWTVAKQTAVLAHEGSHVARGDFYVQLLAGVHRALFWFSPLAWWLPRALASLGEIASDDAAAGAVGDRASYAEILLDVARTARPAATGVAMARGPAVSQRIARLLSEVALPAPITVRRRRTIALGLLPAMLLSAGSFAQTSTISAADSPRAQVNMLPGRMVLPRPDLAYGPLNIPPPKGASGEVELTATVTPDGVVTVTVDKSSGSPVLAEHYRSAIAAAHFLPGTIDGKPQTMSTHFKYIIRQTSSGDIVPPHNDPQNPVSKPDYPADAKRHKDEGIVALMLTVEPDGKVSDAMIAQSSGYPQLDESARNEALTNWRLAPGTVDGKPQAMDTKINVRFKLDHEEARSFWQRLRRSLGSYWTKSKAPNSSSERALPSFAGIPKFLEDFSGRGEFGTVTLLVTVERDGSASKVTVDRSSGNPVLDEKLRTAVANAYFWPGTVKGEPQTMTAPFVVSIPASSEAQLRDRLTAANNDAGMGPGFRGGAAHSALAKLGVLPSSEYLELTKKNNDSIY